jgi:hypothetical protein
MAANLDRFKKDMERLIAQGELLEYSMIHELDAKHFPRQVKEQLGEEKLAASFLKRDLVDGTAKAIKTIA